MYKRQVKLYQQNGGAQGAAGQAGPQGPQNGGQPNNDNGSDNGQGGSTVDGDFHKVDPDK